MKLLKNMLLIIALGMAALPAIAADAKAVKQVILDVRTEAEWNAGHLQGAVLIPHDRINADATTVIADKGTKIYLYCRTGRRTKIAEKDLTKLGYGNVVNLGPMENASKVLGVPVIK